MDPIGAAGIILIAANCIFSFFGFNDESFARRYHFHVGSILQRKEYIRLLTSGFLHVSWPHLLINMFTLLIFSRLLETYVSEISYLAIYFVSLVGGNLLALYIHRNHSEYSAAGASGAISGLVFGSIALFPGLRVGLLFLPVMVPSWLFGILYVLYSVYGIRSRTGNVGHEAHLGGAIAGMLTAIFIWPEMARINLTPILCVFIPSVIFLYVLARHPDLL